MRKEDLTLSFEFFPAKTEEGLEKLLTVQNELAPLNPAFCSVTFGAGGTTQDRTIETVMRLKKNSDMDCAPHLSCIGATRESISELLNFYKENGISRLVTLRGDIPSGMRDPGDFSYANELVSFIREQTGDHFHLEVAAYPEFHPQAPSATADLQNFKRKVDAGADSAITQYFFNPDAYFSFVDSCADIGVELPIIPGIMPINNYVQLARFSDACGAEIPRWIRKRLEAYGDDMESIRSFGLDVITSLCDKLLEGGVPGLHFYTMNQSRTTAAICKNLSLMP
jgi:methylenetetrahydrofolate reductase (NADPH)